MRTKVTVRDKSDLLDNMLNFGDLDRGSLFYFMDQHEFASTLCLKLDDDWYLSVDKDGSMEVDEAYWDAQTIRAPLGSRIQFLQTE